MDIKTTLKLSDIVSSANIAELLTKEDLKVIGQHVVSEYEQDLISRSDWERRTEESMKLALQVAENKSFPWPNASNIKFPLITIAALQYHARSYPVLVNEHCLVRCRVYGDDKNGEKAQRARRIEQHLTFQCLEEDSDWEDDMDRVLITQPIIGCAFKKTYYDPIKGHNVSENILAKDLVVSYWTKSLDTAPRVTHVQWMSKNDLYERHASGLFLELCEDRPQQVLEQRGLQAAQDKAQGLTPASKDSDQPFEIIEQHRFLDLDGDGYQEPYIVVVRRDTKQVLRIVARFFSDSVKTNAAGKIKRIVPEVYFTKYSFIPSPDGGFYDLGFGVLLGPLNESINTIVNQLVDAGTMANTAGGFISRGIKLRGGNYTFAPLEWKHVDTTGDDLKKGIYPLPVREPSNVLFTLLNLLINYGERIGGAVDILTGQNPGQNTPAETSRTMAEQGMKIFTGIYKRTYRSLRAEFKKLYRLNQLYVDRDVRYGDGLKVLQKDYQDNLDVVPSADPNIVSDTQRMMQASALLQAAQASPLYNQYLVHRNYLEALKVPNLDQLLPDPQGPNALPPPVNPQVQIEQMKQQAKQLDSQLKFKLGIMKLMQEADLVKAKITKLEADAVKALEEAGGIKTGHAIAMIEAQIGAQRAKQEGLLKAAETMMKLYETTHADELPEPATPQQTTK